MGMPGMPIVSLGEGAGRELTNLCLEHDATPGLNMSLLTTSLLTTKWERIRLPDHRRTNRPIPPLSDTFQTHTTHTHIPRESAGLSCSS